MRSLQSQNQTSKQRRNHESDHSLDQKIAALVVLNTKMGVMHEEFMSTKFEDCGTQPLVLHVAGHRHTSRTRHAIHHIVEIIVVDDKLEADGAFAILEPGIDVGQSNCNFPEDSGSVTKALQRSTCNNVFQVLLQAQGRLERDDGRMSYLCFRPVIIHSVSDTCVQGVIMSVNGLRQDQDEVDVPAKGFRDATMCDRVAL